MGLATGISVPLKWVVMHLTQHQYFKAAQLTSTATTYYVQDGGRYWWVAECVCRCIQRCKETTQHAFKPEESHQTPGKSIVSEMAIKQLGVAPCQCYVCHTWWATFMYEVVWIHLHFPLVPHLIHVHHSLSSWPWEDKRKKVKWLSWLPRQFEVIGLEINSSPAADWLFAWPRDQICGGIVDVIWQHDLHTGRSYVRMMSGMAWHALLHAFIRCFQGRDDNCPSYDCSITLPFHGCFTSVSIIIW